METEVKKNNVCHVYVWFCVCPCVSSSVNLSFGICFLLSFYFCLSLSLSLFLSRTRSHRHIHPKLMTPVINQKCKVLTKIIKKDAVSHLRQKNENRILQIFVSGLCFLKGQDLCLKLISFTSQKLTYHESDF